MLKEKLVNLKKIKGRLFVLIVVSCFLTSCFITEDFRWTKKANSQLKELGLSKEEVIILASIIEKESSFNDERSKIARVYLNRLRLDMFLQSNPTVLYALGKLDLGRITKSDLEIDSPFNTYKYKGLPPEPICIPSNESIKAVLNSDINEYLYFCAKPDSSGRFNYAETYVEQMRNAKLLIEYLQK
jgi:UPF0755 protein